jgi:hypothetical protein
MTFRTIGFLVSPHMKTETDPVSETLCSSVFLEYRTMDKVQKRNNPEKILHNVS